MMKLQDFQSGITLHVDPLAVQAVVPAIAPPPQGIELAQYIPKVVGSQVMIAGIAPLVVRGLPAEVAETVAKAKAQASRSTVTLN